MWWNSIDMVTASKASSVPRAQRRPDWSPHYQCAERPASTGSLLVPRLREARGGAARSGAALGHPAGTEASEDFWQKMEDSELKLTKASWRREQFLHKDLVVQVDPLHDSSLYDLKLHHNSAQRARTFAFPMPPSSAPSSLGRAATGASSQSSPGGPSRGREVAKDAAEGAPQRMRDLREAFGISQCHTADALGISLKHIDDVRMLGVVDRLGVLSGGGGAMPGGMTVFMPVGRQMTVVAREVSTDGKTSRRRSRGLAAGQQPRLGGRSRTASRMLNEGLKEILGKVRLESSA